MKALIINLKDSLMGKAPLGVKRSSKWPRVRAEHLNKNPRCAVCNGTKKLEVHHIEPYHLAPEKELDPNNLITLCEGKKFVTCHILFGHLGSYKKINLNVREDAEIWNKKLSI
jgi:5-methylcytosine-specific restriction endonuclease McrA